MNIKVVSTLVSMAILSVMAYVFALFSIPMAHAADFIVSDHLAIEAGSLKPLKVDLDTEVSGNLNTSTNTDTKVKSNNSINATVVSSSIDLDTYTRDLARDDEHVSNVDVKNDSVAVSYKEPARIFGLIPTEVTVTVIARNDGRVTVNYPWYAFLSGKNSGSLKPGIQAHVGQLLKTAEVSSTSSTTVAAEMSPQVRVELIQAIHAALKEYRVNAGATASTTVGV